jgi:hypothetical protein
VQEPGDVVMGEGGVRVGQGFESNRGFGNDLLSVGTCYAVLLIDAVG